MKEKKLKYPVLYALMPIVEQTGWYPGLNALEREYGTVGYIASKCYIVGEVTSYLETGESKTRYEVVFPYSNNLLKRYDRFVPSVPTYNFDAQCTNSIYVSKLFGSLEEASYASYQANGEILSREIGILPYDGNLVQKIEILKEKHIEKIAKYKELEEEIERRTTDMEVGMRNLESHSTLLAKDREYVKKPSKTSK